MGKELRYQRTPLSDNRRLFSRVETGVVVVVADLQLQEWLQDGWPLSLASQSLSKGFPPLLPSLPLCLSPFTLGMDLVS